MTQPIVNSSAAFLALMLTALPLAADGDAEWSHSGETGPEHWGTLAPEYAMCDEGRAQSPIDIDTSTAVLDDAPELSIDWAAFAPKLINTGHGVQVNTGEQGGSVTLDDDEYTLLQYHFHGGSEHLIDGQRSPLELHFVHGSAAGDLLVIGVLIEEGAENPALAKLWPMIPAEGEGEAILEPLDPLLLMPEERGAYRYDGSLTTPPCSESVTWHVMANPITASTEQIAAFTALFPDSYRPTQPLNERSVTRID